MNEENMPKVRAYVVGFVLSVLLTVAAYFTAQYHLHSGHRTPPDSLLLPIFAVAAVVQILVQLVFFLHLRGGKARIQRMAFGLAVFVVVLLVGGTIWIMDNLNSHMQHDTKTDASYIVHDEGFQSK